MQRASTNRWRTPALPGLNSRRGLIGANRAYIGELLPHIGEVLIDIGEVLIDNIDAVLGHGEVLIAGSREPEVVNAIERAGPDKLVIDLVRLPGAGQLRGSQKYHGIGW
jgi:GDP-mannose 6-dehydrogenase